MTDLGPVRVALLVAAKEVRSALRDKQTRVYTLLAPLVMYPAMFWVALQAMLLTGALRDARTVAIELAPAAGAEARAAELRDALAEAVQRAGDDGAPADAAAPDTASPESDAAPRTTFAVGAPAQDAAALAARLAERAVEACLFVPATGPVVVVHDASRSASGLARERVDELLEGLVASGREELLGRPVDALQPFAYARRDVAAPEAVGAFLLSTMLPLMLIAMATMGAFFPAVDVTAGEKERRSAETTLLLPVPRGALFAGQVLAVAAACLAATLMNLVGMTLAANHLLGLLTDAVQFALPLWNVLLMLPVMAAFALFVGAVLTAAASLTETFKQGQALLGSVQMVFVLPAMASTLPGIELTYGVAALPIVGASVALREILRAGSLSDVPLGPLALALVVMGLCAALALVFAVRAMRREPGATPAWVAKLTGGRSST